MIRCGPSVPRLTIQVPGAEAPIPDQASPELIDFGVDPDWPETRLIAQICVQHIRGEAQPPFAGLGFYHNTVIDLIEDVAEADVKIDLYPLDPGVTVD